MYRGFVKVRILGVVEVSIKNPNFLNKERDLRISLNKYAYLTMEERIERIGDILALAVWLLLKNNTLDEKDEDKQKVKYLEELA